MTALVGGVMLMLFAQDGSRIEQRLDMLTGNSQPTAARMPLKEVALLMRPLDDGPGILDRLFDRFGNFDRIFEQADSSLDRGPAGGHLGDHVRGRRAAGRDLAHAPPAWPAVRRPGWRRCRLVWLLLRRRRRLKIFAAQLPDALEMLARALRAGQSLGFGFNMVATEVPAPLGKEFGRVFEEQNLGVPLEESLRQPGRADAQLDLRFFVTAVILQRQTGGDLAEILDKIGYLIRDRFRIWGQVQALTGEGRLSGIVLMALPFVLFLAVYQLNPDYVMTLFTDPMGKKMLAVAVIMQFSGPW